MFYCFGGAYFFDDERHRGAEEVMEEPPFLGVEFVDKMHASGIINPIIS